jgi:hypothetical protein
MREFLVNDFKVMSSLSRFDALLYNISNGNKFKSIYFLIDFQKILFALLSQSNSKYFVSLQDYRIALLKLYV